ncbi:MAG: DsbA family protein [Afipia sp.]|nr:DsbA family protein [Afipia sp.]
MIPERRIARFAVVAVLASFLAMPVANAEDAVPNPLSRERILRDAEIPVLGNIDGDITIVEYFDYQCPFCKKIVPVIDQVVKEDGKIRLVLKDWPILGDPSPYAAKLALAAKYQNKFEVAHRALMGRVGRLTEGTIDETLAKAGVDVTKAKADLETNKDAIDALLKRNNEQAEGLGFNGTPAFIVGTFRVPGGLTAEQFKLAIADARKAAKQGGGKGK